MTPIADRLRLPFAGLALASVISLIPGSYLSDGWWNEGSSRCRDKGWFGAFLRSHGRRNRCDSIVVAMTFGLVTPRIFLYKLSQSFLTRSSTKKAR